MIINLGEKNSYTFECPLTKSENNGESLSFATWYRVSKRGLQKDIGYVDGKYDFLALETFTINNLNSDDEGTYICKLGGNGPILKKFNVIIMGE